MAIPSADKAAILSQFWMEFRDDEELKDFVEFNDMGLPLAFFVASGIVQESPMAETYISETFDLFLVALEIDEAEIEGMETLNDVLDYARSKKEGDIN
jgi:hypothetical protein